MIRYTRKKSIRLENYNYAQNGLYFITICTKNSKHLFGNISHGKMRLNRAGEMVERIWSEIPQFYDGFVLHDFVVMPNHFHGIIEIVLTDGQRTTTGGLSPMPMI
jgi:REP element-mobilizing transposase RayT